MNISLSSDASIWTSVYCLTHQYKHQSIIWRINMNISLSSDASILTSVYYLTHQYEHQSIIWHINMNISLLSDLWIWASVNYLAHEYEHKSIIASLNPQSLNWKYCYLSLSFTANLSYNFQVGNVTIRLQTQISDQIISNLKISPSDSAIYQLHVPADDQEDFNWK